MTRILTYISAVIMVAGAMVSCDDEMPVAAPRLVVEGWIDSDGYPVVILTSTITPTDGGGNVADNMIRWGKVSISDGSRTVILTGGPDRDYFPPYTYRTYQMRGEEGATYTIEAEYGGMSCRATSKMLPATAIDSITVTPANAEHTLYAATLHMTSPGEGYYRIFTRVVNSQTRFYPAMLGTFSTGPAGERVSQAILRGKHDTDMVKFVPQFMSGEMVEVMLCHIDRAAYDFWTDFDNTVTFGGSMFVGTPDVLRSNVEGGYGIWSARGTTVKRILIEPSELPPYHGGGDHSGKHVAGREREPDSVKTE
ncbi:MAG: DUF4249 domain-containing protein [Pseudoflavonifractor sp.]|nr:DUF4249 domain-containing protein [Pseudoflavonifractor sp.]